MTKINKTTLLALIATVFVIFLMHEVMDTAKDRGQYLIHFADPFNNRLEPFFQLYMWFLNLFLTPHVSILLTTSIIYLTLHKVWSAFSTKNYLVNFLFFNIVAFGVFNYYLGTSIRMGLAIAVALYSVVQILSGSKFAWSGIIISSLIHYGLSFFFVFFVWFSITKNKSYKFHFFALVIFVTFLIFLFDNLLSLMGLGSYYLAYFYDGFGQTERLIPFIILYILFSFVIIIFFLTNNLEKEIPKFKFLYLASLYLIPLTFYQIITGIAIFSKMLMPQVFLMSVLLTHIFIKRFYLGDCRGLYLPLLIILNFIAVIYALKMFNYL